MRSPCRHVSSSCRCRWGVSTPFPWPRQTPPRWRSSQRSLTWETRTGPTDRSRWPRGPARRQQRNSDAHFISYLHFMRIMFFLIRSNSIIKKRRECQSIFITEKFQEIRGSREFDLWSDTTWHHCWFKVSLPHSLTHESSCTSVTLEKNAVRLWYLDLRFGVVVHNVLHLPTQGWGCHGDGWFEVAEGQKVEKVKSGRSTGEEKGVKGGGGGEERSGSYGDEGSSSLSGVIGRPCDKEIKTIYD